MVPDPNFHPSPAHPGNPWGVFPVHGQFGHHGGPLLVGPGGFPPMPWGIPPGAVGPDGLPVMAGPMGPPPPPPPGSECVCVFHLYCVAVYCVAVYCTSDYITCTAHASVHVLTGGSIV